MDSLGNAVAEIKANGNNLGVISTSMYIHSGPVREDGNKQLYLDRNVTITPTVQPSTPVDIRLYLKGSEFEALKNALNSEGQPSGINDINDVAFFKNSQGCSATQSSTAPVTVTSASWNGADYVLTASITAFSSFYVANKNNIVLPLTLLDFSGKLLNKTAALNWKTDNEINTLSFDIERSKDARNFTTVGNVPAANTSGVHVYNFIDANISSLGSPVVYYRLKTKDINNSFTYSNIVPIAIAGKETVSIYPNPVINKADIIINLSNAENIVANIFDNTGKLIKTEQWNLASGSNAISIDLSSIAKGVYYLQLKGNRTNERKRFVKE